LQRDQAIRLNPVGTPVELTPNKQGDDTKKESQKGKDDYHSHMWPNSSAMELTNRDQAPVAFPRKTEDLEPCALPTCLIYLPEMTLIPINPHLRQSGKKHSTCRSIVSASNEFAVDGCRFFSFRDQESVG
jgi:hypothetical protein